MEIERKFLVKQLPEDLDKCDKAEIEQCYLDFGDGDEPEKRIRSLTRCDETIYFYTEKSAGDLYREEEEFEIPSYSFDNLKELTVSETVKKTRHYLPLGDSLTAELDIYKGAHEGLITVEVEFQSLEASEAFSPPHWFGEEITGNAKYKNKNLAIKR